MASFQRAFSGLKPSSLKFNLYHNEGKTLNSFYLRNTRKFQTSSPKFHAKPYYEEADVEKITIDEIKKFRPHRNVTIHSRFYEDLEIDDLDRMDFILRMEFKFSILLPDRIVVESERVRDITWEFFKRMMVCSALMNMDGQLIDKTNIYRAGQARHFSKETTPPY